MSSRILVVEDDASVAATVVRGLRAAGFEVELATDGELALSAIERERFDAVVLDLGLPRLRGDALLPRCAERDLVVVVLTADGELPTRLACFARGAADFLAKPFFMEELVARLRARMRGRDAAPRIAWDGVELQVDRRMILRDGVALPVTAAEMDLLVYLARRAGRPVSRAALAEHALPSDAVPSERTIDSHVAHLRRKLGPAGRAIETVWSVGYRFNPPSTS
ncbi:response regulator transcription factor [Sandaracinus amylolyticus]|uniref:response regulator transcription factor n=1 Tax=Sandaracinus amylolyticus TaxID=927083 RepID=UPI001F3073F7|nr:response regulator transcription factor [Sandaracinus amylolyticus]UJR85733.1 Hypothetical protein I5071_78130 [Sandaracinus amylolyticus]